MTEEIFSKVKDPRDLGKVKHELEDVLRMALLGTICDCDDFNEIHDFVTERADELKGNGFLRLTNGVPSGDTVKRVMRAVNPTQLRASLDLCRERILKSLKGLHIAIDGKKLRGEDPKSRGNDGMYIMNAWVSENEICVAESKVKDKTNELKSIPGLLATLCLIGALVSIDAMGTHRSIALQIILQGGDYLMALKDNQPILCGLVESLFNACVPMSTHEMEEKGHGRHEKRTCSIMDTKELEKEGMYEEWPGLKRIIKMTRERTVNGVKSVETVYYLSSQEKSEAEYFNRRIRGHWGVENNLHWHLDITFGEDRCRVRTGNAAENLSALRKFSLELLKAQNDKLSINRRRRKCLLNFDYLGNYSAIE